MAAKESELSSLHSLLTNVFTLDCKTCIDEGILQWIPSKNKVRLYIRACTGVENVDFGLGELSPK